MSSYGLTEEQTRLPSCCSLPSGLDSHALITRRYRDTLARVSMRGQLTEDKDLDETTSPKQGNLCESLRALVEESPHYVLLAADRLKAAAVNFHALHERDAELWHGHSKRCIAGLSSDHSVKSPRGIENPKDLDERQVLQRRLSRIRHKLLVLSGKGGVGKSTVAVNLAMSLSLAGKRVGLLDVDIHGPSVPKMLRLEGSPVHVRDNAITPIEIGHLKVMSIGFLLRNRDDAVIWRGPLKMGVIKQFLRDVEWGELDYLVIDSPPGTGDEPLSVCQLIESTSQGLIVTTPQEVATADVRKCINFCRQLKLPVLGVVENMSGFVCPKCGEVSNIFKAGGGERMAREMGVPFLGCIPIDPKIGEACDVGTAYVRHYAGTETAKAFERVINLIISLSSAEPAVKHVIPTPS